MAGISHLVSLVPQVATMTCWYACDQMLLSWRSGWHGNAGRPVYGDNVLGNYFDRRINKQNSPLDPGFFDEFFVRTLHMRLEHAPLSADNVVQWLGFGPLAYSGRYNGYRGLYGWSAHMIVIAGAEVNTAGASLGINDPAPAKLGSRLVMNLDELVRGLPFCGPVVHF